LTNALIPMFLYIDDQKKPQRSPNPCRRAPTDARATRKILRITAASHSTHLPVYISISFSPPPCSPYLKRQNLPRTFPKVALVTNTPLLVPFPTPSPSLPEMDTKISNILSPDFVSANPSLLHFGSAFSSPAYACYLSPETCHLIASARLATLSNTFYGAPSPQNSHHPSPNFSPSSPSLHPSLPADVITSLLILSASSTT
jgi:hypothetical protein